jgi:hypothetical protein
LGRRQSLFDLFLAAVRMSSQISSWFIHWLSILLINLIGCKATTRLSSLTAMRGLIGIFILVSTVNLAQAVIYESAGEPCLLGDNSFTDLSINCSSQVIHVPDNGTITALRVGLIIEHPFNWDLGVALLSPRKSYSFKIILNNYGSIVKTLIKIRSRKFVRDPGCTSA